MRVEAIRTDADTPPDGGRFVRPESRVGDRVSAGGSTRFRAAAGRYRPYVSCACRWPHRAIILRALTGREAAISMPIDLPNDRGQGWRFGDTFSGATTDPVNGFTGLHQACARSAASPAQWKAGQNRHHGGPTEAGGAPQQGDHRPAG